MKIVYVVRTGTVIEGVFGSARSAVEYFKKGHGSKRLARPSHIDRICEANTETLVEYLESGYGLSSAHSYGEYGYIYETEVTREYVSA